MLRHPQPFSFFIPKNSPCYLLEGTGGIVADGMHNLGVRLPVHHPAPGKFLLTSDRARTHTSKETAILRVLALCVCARAYVCVCVCVCTHRQLKQGHVDSMSQPKPNVGSGMCAHMGALERERERERGTGSGGGSALECFICVCTP